MSRSDPQVLEVVQPGEGPLEDSAGLPEPGAVGGTVPGGPEGDAAVQEGTVVLVVVAARSAKSLRGRSPEPSVRATDARGSRPGAAAAG